MGEVPNANEFSRRRRHRNRGNGGHCHHGEAHHKHPDPLDERIEIVNRLIGAVEAVQKRLLAIGVSKGEAGDVAASFFKDLFPGRHGH